MRVSRELWAILAVSILAISAPQAWGADWANPNGGNWSDPANWAGGDVPDTPDEGALIYAGPPYTVTLDMSPSIGIFTLGGGKTLDVLSGRTLRMIDSGGLSMDGVINLNSDGFAAPAILRLTSWGPVWLGDSGAVVLGATGDDLAAAQIITDPNTDIIHGALHTIRGSGIVDALMYEQLGRIIADVPGHELEVRNFLMQCGNDGIGSLEADAGVLSLNGAEVWCGALLTMNGGIIEAKGVDSAIGGLEVFGDLAVRAGATLTAFGGVWNYGTITVNATGTETPTTLRFNRFCWGSATTALEGVGEVHLNAHSGVFDDARVAVAEGVSLRFCGGQTITGRGLIQGPAINEGVISPGGDYADTIKVVGVFTQASESVFGIDIGGTAAGEFDRIENAADFTVEPGAVIALRGIAGFMPASCDSWAVLSGDGTLTGRFLLDASAAEPLPAGLVYRLFHDEAAGTVTLAAVCRADITADCTVNVDDLFTLLDNYGVSNESLPEDGDLDGDGEIGLNDLAILLSDFGESCQ